MGTCCGTSAGETGEAESNSFACNSDWLLLVLGLRFADGDATFAGRGLLAVELPRTWPWPGNLGSVAAVGSWLVWGIQACNLLMALPTAKLPLPPTGIEKDGSATGVVPALPPSMNPGLLTNGARKGNPSMAPYLLGLSMK